MGNEYENICILCDLRNDDELAIITQDEGGNQHFYNFKFTRVRSPSMIIPKVVF